MKVHVYLSSMSCPYWVSQTNEWPRTVIVIYTTVRKQLTYYQSRIEDLLLTSFFLASVTYKSNEAPSLFLLQSIYLISPCSLSLSVSDSILLLSVTFYICNQQLIEHNISIIMMLTLHSPPISLTHKQCCAKSQNTES